VLLFLRSECSILSPFIDWVTFSSFQVAQRWAEGLEIGLDLKKL
jgi:hypothetical protein